MKHEERFVWFDLIRAISAFAVVAGHLRAALIVNFSEVRTPDLIHRVFYFATGLGHEAVIVFFVLSGFFVGGSILNRHRPFDTIRYTVTRLSRLWVVLVPALAATAVIDHFLRAADPGIVSGVAYFDWNSGPPPDASYSATLSTFFGNLLFLQTIYVPVFGTNSPLWSLANEFWYYALFPIAYCAVSRNASLLSRFLLCAVLLVC